MPLLPVETLNIDEITQMMIVRRKEDVLYQIAHTQLCQILEHKYGEEVASKLMLGITLHYYITIAKGRYSDIENMWTSLYNFFFKGDVHRRISDFRLMNFHDGNQKIITVLDGNGESISEFESPFNLMVIKDE